MFYHLHSEGLLNRRNQNEQVCFVPKEGRKGRVHTLHELEMDEGQNIKGLDETARSRSCQKTETHIVCDPNKIKKSDLSLTDLSSWNRSASQTTLCIVWIAR